MLAELAFSKKLKMYLRKTLLSKRRCKKIKTDKTERKKEMINTKRSILKLENEGEYTKNKTRGASKNCKDVA